MVEFPITINKITFMVSEVIPFIRQCESDKAIEYVINKTSCSREEAEEVVADIKNMYNYKYSRFSKQNQDEFNICPQCKTEYSYKIAHCTHCGYSTDKYKKKMKNLQNKETVIENKYVPRCPTCGSSDIKKISTSRKIVGAIGFGLLSRTAKSQFECLNCKYKW